MITILADDLTGAAEVAGVCLRYGLKTAFGVNKLPEAVQLSGSFKKDGSRFPVYDACVIATDSRSMSEEEAIALHRQLALAVKEAGMTTVFKKTDSVLRGHVLAEVKVLMDVFSCRKVLLQPSNPSIERCIKQGEYLIAERPLHESSFADDPDYPAKTSSVSGLLDSRCQASEKPPIITNGIKRNSPGIHIPDCLTIQDLKTGLCHQYQPVLFAGSAAFLAAWLEECEDLWVQQVAFKLDPMSGRYLLVCGSKHTQSQAFIENARRQGTAVAEFPDDFMKTIINQEALDNWADSLAEFWHRTGQMVLSLSRKPVRFENSSEILAARMSSVVHRILGQCRIQEILLVGGTTAWAILQDQGWNALTPVEELAPGVVRMHLENKPGTYLTFKPGSYLWPEDLDS